MASSHSASVEIEPDERVLSPTRHPAHRRAVGHHHDAAQGPDSQPSSHRYSAARRAAEADVPDMSFRALVERHRFLLVTVALLVVLCSAYLYFVITMEMASAKNHGDVASTSGGQSGVGGASAAHAVTKGAASLCKGLQGDKLAACVRKAAEEPEERHSTH